MAEPRAISNAIYAQGTNGSASAVPDELGTLNFLTREVDPFGLTREQAVRIWIALKTKPILVLSGPRGGPRDMLAQTIGTAISGAQHDRLLRLQGHPWWAAGAPNQAQFIQAQERFTYLRLRSFLSRVADSDSGSKLFCIAMLNASRAELHQYFAEHGRDSRFVSNYPFQPAFSWSRFSDRLYWLATIRSGASKWLAPEILDASCVLDLRPPLMPDHSAQSWANGPQAPKLSETLAHCRRFDPMQVHAALLSPSRGSDAFRPLRFALAILDRNGLQPPPGFISDGMLLLGNAWDAAGTGLFSPDPLSNADFAGKFWLEQSALPRLRGFSRSHPILRAEITGWLDRKYPELSAGYRQTTTVAKITDLDLTSVG